MVHIEIDHGKAALRKNLELAGKVVLERRVLNWRDMVLADIGEGAHLEGDFARALIFEALTRRLHDQPRSTRLRSVCDTRLQQEGLGGRQLRRARLDPVVELDARVEGRSMAPRKLCLVGENPAQVEAAGRLALGTGKGANLHLARGVTVIGICHHGERTANIVDDHGGDLDVVIDLGHIRHGAIGDCRDQILALKCAALANKQRARTHLTRVVGRKFDTLVAHGIRLGDNKALGLEQLHIACQSQLLLRRTRHITTSLAKSNLKRAKTVSGEIGHALCIINHPNMPPDLAGIAAF